MPAVLKRTFSKWLCPLCLLVFSSQSIAEFIVKSEYQSPAPYGNAETIPFRYAITGTKPLTPAELASLAEELPQSEINRFYGRASVNFTNLSLTQIKNRSKAPNAFTNVSVAAKDGYRSQIGGELAIGYTFEQDVRAELEFLINRNFNKTFFPILNTVPQQALTVDIQNLALLANMYYDFTGYDRFRPYIMLGIGLSANDTTTTVAPPPPAGASGSQKKLWFVYNAGIGFRVSFFTRWFVDIKYRYTYLGQIRMNNNFNLNANYTLNGVSVGLIYIF